MFTGIVQAMGQLAGVEDRDGDLRLKFATGKLDLANLELGDSIAVNGACLTAIMTTEAKFAADVSRETLAQTTLGDLRVSSPVNLERSLTLSASLGGHLVSGHVDGVGVLIAREPDARSTRMEFELPAQLARYVARKGSITVDGTSLTVNDVNDNRFCVNIVPHTLERTIMGEYDVGSRVNIEVDLIARYLERLNEKA